LFDSTAINIELVSLAAGFHERLLLLCGAFAIIAVCRWFVLILFFPWKWPVVCRSKRLDVFLIISHQKSKKLKNGRWQKPNMLLRPTFRFITLAISQLLLCHRDTYTVSVQNRPVHTHTTFLRPILSVVCYERGLFRVVRYDWSVMNKSVLKRNHAYCIYSIVGRPW